LVLTSRLIAVEDEAYLEVVGALSSNDPDEAFVNFGGTVVIRYDPAVLGTRGLLLPRDQQPLAWIVSWEELP
jgi:hypothetical protein